MVEKRGLSRIKHAQKESLISKKVATLLNQLAQDNSLIAELQLNSVVLSPDKSTAYLYFYVVGGQEAFNEKVKNLILYKPSLRSGLAKLIPSRYTPELIFKYDKSLEKEIKVNALIDQEKQNFDADDI